jgi:Rrf2 family iron-sulfur cluster assembly transcriptional regulator
MAMVEIAKRGDAKPVSLAEVAARLDLSLAYLEQLFMKLRRRGLVQSVRGPGGGYVLNRNADAISVGEIMAAADEPVKMTRCGGDDLGCVATKRCSTHYLWDALGAHIEQFLATATLGDVLHGRYAPPVEDVSLTKLAVSAETAP